MILSRRTKRTSDTTAVLPEPRARERVVGATFWLATKRANAAGSPERRQAGHRRCACKAAKRVRNGNTQWRPQLGRGQRSMLAAEGDATGGDVTRGSPSRGPRGSQRESSAQQGTAAQSRGEEGRAAQTGDRWGARWRAGDRAARLGAQRHVSGGDRRSAGARGVGGVGRCQAEETCRAGPSPRRGVERRRPATGGSRGGERGTGSGGWGRRGRRAGEIGVGRADRGRLGAQGRHREASDRGWPGRGGGELPSGAEREERGLPRREGRSGTIRSAQRQRGEAGAEKTKRRGRINTATPRSQPIATARATGLQPRPTPTEGGEDKIRHRSLSSRDHLASPSLSSRAIFTYCSAS